MKTFGFFNTENMERRIYNYLECEFYVGIEVEYNQNNWYMITIYFPTGIEKYYVSTDEILLSFDDSMTNLKNKIIADWLRVITDIDIGDII